MYLCVCKYKIFVYMSVLIKLISVTLSFYNHGKNSKKVQIAPSRNTSTNLLRNGFFQLGFIHDR